MILTLAKFKENNTKGGFSLQDLTPIIDEMVDDGTLIERPTMHRNIFFINH